MKSREISEIAEKVTKLMKRAQEAEIRLQLYMEQLQELGFDSVDEAEQWLEETELRIRDLKDEILSQWRKYSSK